MDTNTSRYWTICIITNPFDKDGRLTSCYKNNQSVLAEKFFEDEFPQLSSQKTLSNKENQYIQASLWRIFHDNTLVNKKRALAGLCLRCYISHSIVKGCQILANKSPDNPTLFPNLLSYVLNDDGSTFIVVDSDGKTQLILNKNGLTQSIPREGNFFSVDILRTYNPNLSNSNNNESLDNWCIRCTKQNKDLQPLLLEYGIWIPSDWSLLCREVPQSLNTHFTNDERQLIEVFHGVYRRDRRKSRQRGRCSEPTHLQLEEMLGLLRDRDIILRSENELIHKLQEIAKILRQDNHSIKTGKPQADSIDISNSSKYSNDYFYKLHELGTENNNCEDMEENVLREILNQLPPEALYHAIAFRIPQRVELLAAKKSSRAYADKFVDGLRLYYHEFHPFSLKDIAKEWDINWAKARRIFQLSELIDNIQYTSEEIFISKLQEEASQFLVSEISCNPNNLKEITEGVRSFLDKIAFTEARAEIIAARIIYKNSLFAQILRKYMNNQQKAA